MKRFPLVFLSLVILVTCTWLAISNTRVGKAAPDRALPWWFGDDWDDFYHEYACVDGMNLWIMAVGEDANIGDTFTIKGTSINSGVEIVDETLPFQYQGAGIYSDRPYAEHLIKWSEILQPGTVIEFEFHSEAFILGYDYPFVWDTYVRDCTVPTSLIPNQFRMVFAREYLDGEWWDLDLPIVPGGCISETRLIGVARNFVISDADVSIDVTSDSPALLSAKLTSPSGTSVKFIDENHSPAYQFGTTVRDEDLSINVAGAQLDW